VYYRITAEPPSSDDRKRCDIAILSLSDVKECTAWYNSV